MKRRDFLSLLGGATTACVFQPFGARAQQPAPGLPRVVFFANAFPDEPDTQARHKEFREALGKLGWADGRNVRIEEQWGRFPAVAMRAVAAELVRTAPAVIMTTGSGMAEALKLESRTVPVVFAAVTDPVASGLVGSMARPGGNLTGFANYEFSIGGKWLSLLKEAAPTIARVLVLLQPGNIGQQVLLRGAEAAAPTLGVQVVPAVVNSGPAVESAIEAFAKAPNGGLIGLPGSPSLDSSDMIIALAARHQLPALYTHRFSTATGGLMSYDTEITDLYRRAAGYVDRILKGEKPSDLPVQLPTKYDLVINLKTAKALGLSIPLPLLALADEVIE